MVFLCSGCPRGRWSSRSCRVHWKQRARRNHGSIRPQGLQCKASESVCINNSVRSCLSPMFYFLFKTCFIFTSKGWPRKDGWTRISRCCRSKSECCFMNVWYTLFCHEHGVAQKNIQTNKQNKVTAFLHCLSVFFVFFFDSTIIQSYLKSSHSVRKSNIPVSVRRVISRFVNCHFVSRVLLGKTEKLDPLAPPDHL